MVIYYILLSIFLVLKMFPVHSNVGTLILKIHPGLGTGKGSGSHFHRGSSLGKTRLVDHCCSSPNKLSLLFLLISLLQDWTPRELSELYLIIYLFSKAQFYLVAGAVADAVSVFWGILSKI